jgi:hypothetical protein
MEQVLREAEAREAEIDAAHKQAQADLRRVRDGLAAAERKLEMSQQQAATTHGTRAGLAEEDKMRIQAATKLQARHRGNSTRSAMRELNIQPPTAAQAQSQALADSATPAEKQAGIAARLSSSASRDMLGEMKLWAEVRLPAGADSRALQEAKLRRAANGALLRVESTLSISQIKMMSGEMARLGALEATAQSELKVTAERLRVAFPTLAWQGPRAGTVSMGPAELSQSLDAAADFVERAATMHAQSMASAAEEVARAQAAAAAATATRSLEHLTPPASPKVVDASVQVESQPDYQPAVPVLNAPPARPIVKDANCSPHASPREVLRVMLRGTGLLDAAEDAKNNERKPFDISQVAAAKKTSRLWQKRTIASRAALREPDSPEVEMVKLASVCQWEDRIRQFVDASPTTVPHSIRSTARSSSAPSIRRAVLRDPTSALPPLADRELELWQEQLVVLKQRLHAGALRATEAERRGKQLASQLRVALQATADAEERYASNGSSTPPPPDDDVHELRREVHQLRRLLSMLTPGLHGQSLPWSPRLSAAGTPAVVHARAASPSDDPGGGGGKETSVDPEAATQDPDVFRRLHSQESSSEKRWLQRRADLQDEGARSTEAVMQAFSSVRHTGAVFAQMRSRFDAPHDGPEPGGFDQLLAEAHTGDPSLPPLRRGAGATVADLWPSPASTPWQPVQSLGRSLSRPGSRAGIRSAHSISRPKKASDTAARPIARLQRTYAGTVGGRGFPKVKLAGSATAPALY